MRCRLYPLTLILFSMSAFTLLRTDTAPAQGKVVADFDATLLDVFQARNIGPANMGGRIVDLAVVEKDPATYYVAAATGGVWKTTDAGATWKPITDHLTCSIGAIAVSQKNPDIVWMGAGEANPRNSVTWGDGVYRSTDGGKSWSHMGLKDSHHIGRIVIHPTNPEIVYVAALGHTWGANAERGVFKTIDGGKNWQHVLKFDADTGCIDVAIDPAEHDTLYACMYGMRRDAFSGGDPLKQYTPAAGLYKTTDGGKKWEKMTKGLPENQYGRCGVSIYQKDPKVVYAVVQTEKTVVGTKGNPANGKPAVEDGGVFRSDDRGASWTQVNTLVPRPFYYGQIRVDPVDDQRVYVLGVAFHLSSDGGKSFQTSGGAIKKGGAAIHPDHHALWIDPADNKHLILGNDGGLYISKNRAGGWTANRGLPLAQFYGIAADMRKPYRVYGGLQDNGSWGGPSATRTEEGITLADWKRINTADGFHCQCDPNDVNTVYAESQYGKPIRFDVATGKAKAIQPKSADKTDAYRFNWSSPMLLSPHNSKTLFYGGNYLFRSDDRGDTWKKISPDLTAGKAGIIYKSTGHTLTAIAESPKKAGLIYVGSDDGRVHVTADGGTNWTDVSDKIPGVPKARWITRVECSHHEEGTAYLTIGRHRNDDFKPYVYKTTDHGATWTSIANNLPADGPVHVIRESSKNPNLLFVGTEYAVFVSLDAGKVWHRFKAGLPKTPMHDLVIHPRERDLVIGTHGRGIYVVDIGPLEEMTPKALAQPAHLFSVRTVQSFTPAKVEKASKSYVAPNPAYGATMYFHLQKPAKDVNVSVLDAKGVEVNQRVRGGAAKAGLHRVQWDLQNDFARTSQVSPGEYTVRLTVDGERFTQKLRIEAGE
jgi:photosystem II stability/assembly factor-like uncharacterized protein